MIWKTFIWWRWMICGHLFFVTLFFAEKFTDVLDWLDRSKRMFNIGGEMNYAVWWSGICLFTAAVLFYRCSFSKDLTRVTGKFAWYAVALIMMCLTIDEIGSLHERVYRYYGFGGYIPFAIIFGGGFLFAIIKFLRYPATKKTALFIALGLLCFFAVGGLEYFEKTRVLEKSFVKPARLVLEETLELVGISFLILAGLVAVPRESADAFRLKSLFGAWEEMPGAVKLITVFFIVQCCMYLGILSTDKWSYRRGNPISVFPVVVFFLAAMRCFYLSGKAPVPSLVTMVAAMLLLASIAQLTNYNYKYAGTGNYLDGFVIWDFTASWILTLAPFLTVVSLLVIKRLLNVKTAMITLGLLLILMLVLFNLTPSKFHYYFYSGCVGYICFLMIRKLSFTAPADTVKVSRC